MELGEMCLSIVRDGDPHLDEVVHPLREVYPIPNLVQGQVAIRCQDLRSRTAFAERAADLE